MSKITTVSPTIEEYLETIYKLQEIEGQAKTTKLAKQLKVALGTITNTIESMEKQNLVKHKPYKGVKLTGKGQKIALDVIRGHRLSERLLTDILKFEWSKAHEAACKLEHIFTDKELSKSLEKVLGHPKTCPHGNPIPSESGKLPEEQSKVLTSLNTGEKGIITKVTDERTEMLQYLATLKLVPGASLKIEEKAPFNGPIIIENSHALGRNVAAVIWVKKT